MRNPHASPYSRLPSVDRLLNAPELAKVLEQHGRETTKCAIQLVLEQIRQALRSGEMRELDQSSLVERVTLTIEADDEHRLRRVINLSGTVLHTNLGRASLPAAAVDAVVEAARGPSNLEFDLASGRRGDRDCHVERQICQLTGAEAATVVNNNAAAVMLALNSLALHREVLVSRGELVEIGGSFRIPDIVTQAGALLREVGTTNRTHLRDFENAIGPQTALILKVHQSNYVIEGFTATVEESALAELGQGQDIPLIVDLGSGTLIDLERIGLPHEATPMDALRHGADLVTFSGDKLLGGPQAGFIVGRKDLIAVLKSNPMKRALRCDKMTIAALSSVLQLYRHPETLAQTLPGLRQMTRSLEQLRASAERLQTALVCHFGGLADVAVEPCTSEIGSGALPGRGLDSWCVAIRARQNNDDPGLTLANIATLFRDLPVPVIGRISRGAFHLDVRCLDDEQELLDQIAALER